MDKMDENRIEELEHNGYLIQYTPKLGVRNISTNERNLTFELLSMWRYNNFHSYTHHLYDFSDFQMEIKNKIIELCILAKNIKQTNGELYCHISSHIFGALAEYPQILRNFHLYMNALKFWKFILQIIKEWEGENPENEIHKGAIYGFIAETNMNIGDYEIAFTNLHRAVREDFNIEEYIPDYGRTAPGYKIITLRPSKDHWMW
jgi:hypothetical protein